MCSENMTSLGRKEGLFDLKREGVVTHNALALQKCALAQSVLAALASCKDPDREDLTNKLCLEGSFGSQRETRASGVSNPLRKKIPFARTTPSTHNPQFCRAVSMYLNILAILQIQQQIHKHPHQARVPTPPIFLKCAQYKY